MALLMIKPHNLAIFAKKCPSCTAHDVMIKRCKVCGYFACVNCSLGGVCIDCYTLTQAKNEIGIYFFDKSEEACE